MAVTNRRRLPRLAVDNTVQVELQPGGGLLTVVNVSQGGFAVATDRPFITSSQQACRFVAKAGGWSASLTATPIFYGLEPEASGPHAGKFVTGFGFTDLGGPGVRQLVEDLIAHAAGQTA